jgi:two-component system, LuxR family, response regulator FixJ
MSTIRNTVFLVDDSRAIRTALSRLLEAAGYLVRTFECAEDYLAEKDDDAPGCLLLDVCMPGLTGPELQQALTARGRERPIVFLTAKGNIQTTVNAMKSGAVDFLTKPVDDALLFAALDRAFLRDAENRTRRTIQQAIQRRLDSLTPREREVMTQVVCGRLNKLIAMEIGTGEKTVKVHRARMMSKMAAASVAELVRMGAHVGVSMEPSMRPEKESGEYVLHWTQA